jgi:hypothetical protein
MVARILSKSRRKARCRTRSRWPTAFWSSGASYQ